MLRSLKRAVKRGTSQKKSKLFSSGKLEAHKLTLPFHLALDLKRQPCADDFIVSIGANRLEIDSAYLHQPVYESHSSLVITFSEIPAAEQSVRVAYIPMNGDMYITDPARPGEYIAVEAFDEEVAISVISAENSAYAEIALADEELSDADLSQIDSILPQQLISTESTETSPPELTAVGESVRESGQADVDRSEEAAPEPADQRVANEAEATDAATVDLQQLATGVNAQSNSRVDRRESRDFVTLFDNGDWACEINEHRVFLRLPAVLDLRHQPMVGDFIISVDDERVHCRAVLIFCESAGERPSLVFFLDKAAKGLRISVDYLGLADSLRLIDGRSIAPFSFSQCLKTYRSNVGLVDPSLRLEQAGDPAMSGDLFGNGFDTGLTHTALELEPRQYRDDGWQDQSWKQQTDAYFAGNQQAREQLAAQRVISHSERSLSQAGAINQPPESGELAEVNVIAPPNCLDQAAATQLSLFADSCVEQELAKANRSQWLMTQAMLGTGLVGILCFVYFLAIREF